MAGSTRTIDVLLKEIADPALRTRLADAVNALRKQTRFGLVFEGHHPEVSRLPDVQIRKGALVARKSEKGNALFTVDSINKGKATCIPEELPPDAKGDMFQHALTLPVSDLVIARRFGDPIYPSLKFVDSIQRSAVKPWHILLRTLYHRPLNPYERFVSPLSKSDKLFPSPSHGKKPVF
jgi:adenine-specific DNA-methyltransferase